MREIPYVINRSRFLPIIEEHLSRLRNQLDTGLAVQIDFEIGGYNGDVTIVIHSNDAYAFQTDWPGRDYTRFPQRIRAAATALQLCGFVGMFRIIHENGVLIIRLA